MQLDEVEGMAVSESLSRAVRISRQVAALPFIDGITGDRGGGIPAQPITWDWLLPDTVYIMLEK